MFSEATKYFLGMYENGELPAQELDSFLMERIPDEGGKAAFDQLPQELQNGVMRLIQMYQETGSLMRIGAEMHARDLAPVAERFIKEVLGESITQVNPSPK